LCYIYIFLDKHVIHVVGPNFKENKESNEDAVRRLAQAYRNVLLEVHILYIYINYISLDDHRIVNIILSDSQGLEGERHNTTYKYIFIYTEAERRRSPLNMCGCIHII